MSSSTGVAMMDRGPLPLRLIEMMSSSLELPLKRWNAMRLLVGDQLGRASWRLRDGVRSVRSWPLGRTLKMSSSRFPLWTVWWS